MNLSCSSFNQHRILFFGLLTLFVSITHAAVETPATLIISGTIGSGVIAPSQNDRVYAVLSNGSGAIESIGSVQDSSGFFAIQISKTTDFNGSELTLLLEHAGIRYQLLENGEPVSFIFSGGFFPVTLTLNLSVGSSVGGTSTGGGSSTGGNSGSVESTNGDSNTSGTGEQNFDSQFDVNGDGQFSQSDVDAVKQAIAKNTKLSAADVNGDGLYNTRDIIGIIKAHIQFVRSAR